MTRPRSPVPWPLQARPTRWWAMTRPGTSPRIRRRGPGQRPGPGHHHRHGAPGHRAEADHHREQRGRLHRLRNAGRNDSGKRRRRARRLRQPASGDEHVLGLHAAPTGTLAGSERFGPGPSGPKPSMPPAFPTPIKQRRLADAASPAAPASRSTRHGPPPARTPARAVPDWKAGLWRSCEFGSFVLGTTDDRPRERSRRSGSLPTPPAGQPE